MRLKDDATNSVELSPDGDPSDFIIADGEPNAGSGSGVQAGASGLGFGTVSSAVVPHREWYTPLHARKRRIYGSGAGTQRPGSGSGQGWTSDDEEALVLLIA